MLKYWNFSQNFPVIFFQFHYSCFDIQVLKNITKAEPLFFITVVRTSNFHQKKWKFSKIFCLCKNLKEIYSKNCKKIKHLDILYFESQSYFLRNWEKFFFKKSSKTPQSLNFSFRSFWLISWFILKDQTSVQTIYFPPQNKDSKKIFLSEFERNTSQALWKSQTSVCRNAHVFFTEKFSVVNSENYTGNWAFCFNWNSIKNNW